MILVTVGTLFPFDRLVRAIDELVEQGAIEQDVFGQIGCSKYKPKNFEYAPSVSRVEFEEKVERADYLIGHAGMGSITTALQHNKPLLVIPRLKKYQEAVNDHQVDTARKFEELGHVLAAYDASEIPRKLEMLKTFTPKPRKAQPEKVAARISEFLESL